MFYEVNIGVNGMAYVNIPDDLNQNMAIKVFENDGTWKVNKQKKPDDSDGEEIQKYEYAELLHPNLFIHQEGEKYYSGDKLITVEDGIIPDMEYFSLIDQDFFEKMIYYWSKIDDYDFQSLLDVIDENKDYIVASAFVIDILE